MATSRRSAAALVVLAALGIPLGACDAILGLGSYSDVPCSGDCGTGDDGPMFDSTGGPTDAGPDGLDASDAGDAGDASDVGLGSDASDAMEAAALPDAPFDAPSLVSEWAQWPMPNPVAPIAPDAATMLPFPMAFAASADGGMAFDAGGEGDASTVYDTVTKLTWASSVVAAATLNVAVDTCSAMTGGAFHVPTRIQLVSLIDFTRAPLTIDTTIFHGVASGALWTSSPVIKPPTGPTGAYWTLDFSTGLPSNTATGVAVLCVAGGP